jgi:hypothetical protein
MGGASLVAPDSWAHLEGFRQFIVTKRQMFQHIRFVPKGMLARSAPMQGFS